MATIKAYTDLEQSRKLAEILPVESADMKYPYFSNGQYGITALFGEPIEFSGGKDVPCWSLAALIDFLSANFHTDIKYLDNQWELDCRVQVTYERELVDACVEMVLRLSEKNFL